MLKALRERSIALLWGGQALSAVGDEIYRVALIWLAVGLIGADAGYLTAAQSAALLVLSLVGGHWADEWDHRRAMIGVDALRALIVLLPVAAFYRGGVTLTVLLATALGISSLSAFFDPALQATLPDVSPDLETLEAATGLMGTTVRLARAVGPALVGLLGPLLPTIHFFTLDSASFAVSAWSISRLRARMRTAPAPRRRRAAFRESLAAGFRAVRANPLMSDLFLVRGAVAALWGLAFYLGLALLVRAMAPGDMRAFGWTVALYGGGNVAGALFVGNIRRRRATLILFGGYACMGLGFAAMGAAPSLSWLGAASVLAGFGGPVNDVPFFDLVQRGYPIDELTRIFRLRMAVETGCSLLLMSFSPVLLRAYSPRPVIIACGLGIAALGAAGLAVHARRDPEPSLGAVPR
ncbi:MAG TPA: MFS transporter [Elusimicrobiota bacterium]|nr:MFS transporter [Elusimicrobiota bacterium]